MHVILQPGLSVFDAARAYLKEGETAALFGRLDEVILGADLSQPEGRINLTGEIHVKADIFYTREGPRLFAVACWADHGVLRSASGLLIGGRICAAELFQGGEGIKATPPDPVEAAIEPPQPRPAARISRARPVKRAAEPSPSAPTESEGHTEVDLSPELAELAPIPTPQPAALGWAAAVAASQRTVTAAIAAQS
ncbi:hypothetical protein KKB55_11695 [Myxococcota bacterium]|nr:hypothetical protein [Myxococcota bacterium]